MRLAVFTSEFPAHVNTFFARDMRALLENGIDIDIFPIRPLNSGLWSLVPDILDEDILDRNKVHHISIGRSICSIRPWTFLNPKLLADLFSISRSAVHFGPVPLAKSLYVFPKSISWMRHHLSQCDHILSYWGNYAGTCAYLCHRLLGRAIPYSIFLHAGTDLYRDQVFLRQKLAYADNIFVVCDFNKRFVQQLYPDLFPAIESKIHLHHLGLDFSEFPFSIERKACDRLIGVGSLSKRKGFEYLVRAGAILRKIGHPVEIEHFGDGPELENIGRISAELGIADHVHMHGWKPFSEVRRAMQDATVLVHPSAGLGDAVPTVIKEALSMGLPVVASDVAGIPELLDYGNCGMMVPPREPEAIATAVETLLTDKSLGRSLSLNGRIHMEKICDMWKNGAELARCLTETKRI